MKLNLFDVPFSISIKQFTWLKIKQTLQIVSMIYPMALLICFLYLGLFPVGYIIPTEFSAFVLFFSVIIFIPVFPEFLMFFYCFNFLLLPFILFKRKFQFFIIEKCNQNKKLFHYIDKNIFISILIYYPLLSTILYAIFGVMFCMLGYGLHYVFPHEGPGPGNIFIFAPFALITILISSVMTHHILIYGGSYGVRIKGKNHVEKKHHESCEL